MSSSDTNINATVERLAGYVGGTTSTSDRDLCDWSKGPVFIDWPGLIAHHALLIAGVLIAGALLVRIIGRKRKQRSN